MSHNGGMARVLLVEDEATLLDILRQAFVIKRWEVDTATSADEALARFDQATPDVVLTDKNLPGGAIVAAQAGVELVRAIRKRDPAVGIVMMTAFGTLESARDTLNLGVDEYLEKPFANLFDVVDGIGALAARVAERRRAAATPRTGDARTADALTVVVAASAERRPFIARVFATSGHRLVWVEKPDDIKPSAQSERAAVVILDGGSYPEETTCLVAELKTRARSSSCVVISQHLSLGDVRRLIELEVRALIDEPIDSERCAEQLRAAVERARRR
jgi:DNA-binding NtrC family response regulator